MNNLTSLLTAIALMAVTAQAQADFQPEAVGIVETLPSEYPDHWVMIHDVSFFHMQEGKIHVVDPLEENLGGQFKGMMTAGFIAGYLRSEQRNEHYVMESFHSRGARGGERTDFVTVWDPATLSVAAEIEIPAKRITGMPKTTMNGLIGDDRFLGVYNFNPAQSVSIVDLEKRAFVGEVPTPGCGFVLPTGERSFTSICSNGTLLTSHLDADGNLKGTSRTEQLFDANDDPIFETAAVTGGMAYFPTFTGEILPLDISGSEVKAQARWSLAQNDEEKTWRPGGMNLILADSAGAGYVLMHPDGGEGTHKNGGSEVWVYDLAAGKRLNRIELANWGVSMGTSGTGDDRLLFVTNGDFSVDVYSAPSGEFIKTLNTGAQTPFLVHGAH